MIYNNNIPSSHICSKNYKNSSDKVVVYNNRIPSNCNIKISQILDEQNIQETVGIYKEAIPYIVCEIRSTIQHESGHRKDEEQRYKSKQQGDNVIPFDKFVSEDRAEGIAEQEEENCSPPQDLSGEVVYINLNDLFGQAKSSSVLPSDYKSDIRAGTLDPRAQGMYLMQDIPSVDGVSSSSNPNSYSGFDGTIWVDVRKIAAPFIAPRVNAGNQYSKPPTFQDDGTQEDVPGVSRISPSPSVPATPSVPSVPSVESR